MLIHGSLPGKLQVAGIKKALPNPQSRLRFPCVAASPALPNGGIETFQAEWRLAADYRFRPRICCAGVVDSVGDYCFETGQPIPGRLEVMSPGFGWKRLGAAQLKTAARRKATSQASWTAVTTLSVALQRLFASWVNWYILIAGARQRLESTAIHVGSCRMVLVDLWSPVVASNESRWMAKWMAVRFEMCYGCVRVVVKRPGVELEFAFHPYSDVTATIAAVVVELRWVVQLVWIVDGNECAHSLCWGLDMTKGMPHSR